MDWLDIPELNGIDLTESYVLGWNESAETVTLQLELVLCPDHPDYCCPPETEYACFRHGSLTFIGVSSTNGLPNQSSVRAYVDANGESDYGHIESFSVNSGVFSLGLECGLVTIKADLISMCMAKHN